MDPQPTRNQHWLLKRRPPAPMPTEDDFELGASALPDPGPNQCLSRTIYVSLDPYQWGRRRGGVEVVGEVCHARTVSQVTKSRHADFREGDFIFNTNGWQEYGLTGDGIRAFTYMFPRRLDAKQAPISTAVGVMGMLGLTAYAGLVVQCAPRAGETVAVSAASGGVGQIAGQLAKIAGCRVIGIAGAEHKCKYVVDELHFDACVSHLSPNFREQLAAACPSGIDIYFENVGGAVFEAVLPLMNASARITLCGMIAQMTRDGSERAREAWFALGAPFFHTRSIAVHALAVGNFVASHQQACFERMASWIREGRIRYREDLWQGIEQTPRAFAAMLGGDNFGKTLVQYSDDPSLTTTDRLQRSARNVLAD